MKVELDLEEGSLGEWKVEKFIVTPEDEKFQKIRCVVTMSGRYVPAGSYHRLTRNGSLVMSSTPDEIDDSFYLVNRAKGNILINGLGLGAVLHIILPKKEVRHVKVVEISSDLIELVGKHYLRKYPGKLEIVNADAYEYKPPKGERYDYVWHDIWDTISGDNLEGMKKLHRKYGRRTEFQESWCRYLCERR